MNANGSPIIKPGTVSCEPVAGAPVLALSSERPEVVLLFLNGRGYSLTRQQAEALYGATGAAMMEQDIRAGIFKIGGA